MKDKVLIIITLLEILGIFSCFIFSVYICLTQNASEVVRVMLPLGFWVFAIVSMTNIFCDKYNEKHKKYKIVYLVNKEKYDEINTNEY